MVANSDQVEWARFVHFPLHLENKTERPFETEISCKNLEEIAHKIENIV